MCSLSGFCVGNLLSMMVFALKMEMEDISDSYEVKIAQSLLFIEIDECKKTSLLSTLELSTLLVQIMLLLQDPRLRKMMNKLFFFFLKKMTYWYKKLAEW